MDYHVQAMETNTPQFIHLQNEGPLLKHTNWWSLPEGESFFFLSILGGCMRLLVPPACVTALPDMQNNVKDIVVSRLDSTTSDSNATVVEILFDDDSEAPFVIHLCESLVLMLPQKSEAMKRFPFHVYVNHDGPLKVIDTEAYFRVVPRMPWLKPINPKRFR